jgi:hypothetical protein
MAGRPKSRAKKQARGEAVAPLWRDHPELSSRPPFTEGNLMALRHGAESERVVDPVAAQLAGDLLADRPDLQRFPEALLAWSRAEARCLLLERWIVEHGLLDAKGKATVSERLLVSCERLAMSLRERLGLDPKSEAELARDQADAAKNVVDLEVLRARGRQALAERVDSVRDAGELRGGVDEVREIGDSE